MSTSLSSNPSDSTTHASLFVSYSRKDRAFAERLAAALSNSSYQVWVDLQDIPPSADWRAEIEAAIEGADAVVFVVSPDSVAATSVCAIEIEHAVSHNKRLVPVLWREVNTREQPVADAVRKLNWIRFADDDGFDRGMVHLQSAIDTDLDRVRSHTRLLQRAVEWDRAQRDDSFVLQKNDLSAAERWLADAALPAPTSLQTAYVIESRAVAARRQRRLLLAGAAAFAMIAAGAAIAIYQGQQADDRRTEAQARAAAAEAQLERGRRIDRAIPLALQALTTRPLTESVDAALSVGQTAADVLQILRGHLGAVRAACFLPGGNRLVSAGSDGRVILWDIDSGSPLQLLGTASEAAAIACHPSQAIVAVAGSPSRLTLWNVADANAAPLVQRDEPDSFIRLRFSANGAWLATTDGVSVIVRSTANALPVTAIGHAEGMIMALAVSDDGKQVAFGTGGGGDRAGEVVLWRRDSKEPQFKDAAYALAVASIGLGAAGDRVTAIGIEAEIKAWGADGVAIPLKMPADVQPSESAVSAVTHDGQRLVLADGRAAWLLRTDGQPNDYARAQRLAGHATPITAVALLEDRAATGSDDGTIIVHRLRSNADLVGGARVLADSEQIDDAVFNSDGRAVHVRAGEPPRWYRRTTAEIALGPAPSAASAVPGNPASAPVPRWRTEVDGETAKFHEGTHTRWTLVPEQGHEAIDASAAADGRVRAAASENLLRVANDDAPTGAVSTLPPGFGLISAIAVRPDGRLIAVAGGDAEHALAKRFGMTDRMILLVDTASGRPVGLPLVGMQPVDVSHLAFSADGQALLSVGSEAVLWNVAPEAWLRRACAAIAVGIDAAEWQRRLPAVPYPRSCPRH